MDGHCTITQTLLGMLCGQYQQQQQIVKILTGNKQQSVALDSLRRAGECRVTMTALVECVARLLDNAEFLVHQLLQLLTHTSTLTINRFIIINTFVYSAISLLEPPNQPFNGLFSRTTWVSQYQKGKTSLDFTGARDSQWQWHQLGHMQVCTSLQTDNHASTPPLCFFTGRMPFLPPNQQRQSTEGTISLLEAQEKSTD